MHMKQLARLSLELYLSTVATCFQTYVHHIKTFLTQIDKFSSLYLGSEVFLSCFSEHGAGLDQSVHKGIMSELHF